MQAKPAPIVGICLVSRSASPPCDVVDAAGRARDHAIRCGIETHIGIGSSGHSVDFGRNLSVAHARQHHPDITHLLILDDDVLIPEATIPALLNCGAGIAGGCYPGRKKVGEGLTAPLVLVRQDGGWLPGWFNGVIDAEVVPGGCMLVDVAVLDALGFPWFRWPQVLKDGVITHMTEDVDFCERATAAGFDIRANGDVRCSHLNRIDLSQFVAGPGCEPVVSDWHGPVVIEHQTAGV